MPEIDVAGSGWILALALAFFVTACFLIVSLRYGSIAWSFGLLGLALALAATWLPQLWVSALTVGVLGWICITILGYAYKVAGFLAWQTAKERNPSAQLPALSSAVSLPAAHFALALLALGTVLRAVCSAVAPAHMQLGLDLCAAGGLSAVAALAKLASISIFKGTVDGIAAGSAG